MRHTAGVSRGTTVIEHLLCGSCLPLFHKSALYVRANGSRAHTASICATMPILRTFAMEESPIGVAWDDIDFTPLTMLPVFKECGHDLNPVNPHGLRWALHTSANKLMPAADSGR